MDYRCHATVTWTSLEQGQSVARLCYTTLSLPRLGLGRHGASMGESLCQPPPELPPMDGSKDEDVDVPRASKVIHTAFMDENVNVSFRDEIVSFMDENVSFIDEIC
jgi:hypothetical protein